MIGIGISCSVTEGLVLLINIFFSSYDEDLKEGHILPDRRVFQGLGEIFALGLPAGLMYSIDFWSTSLVVIIAGYISIEAQSA